MKLYQDKPNYVRLDDDVSFQIVRTNPKLTTNTKLMYDGENLYMESYDAEPLLSTLKYKHHRIWKNGLFNRDIRNFLLGSNTTAYEVGQTVRDTVMLTDFDDQFENMYWCGVESIGSDFYPQEMGCVAPLYIRKKLPNYFVIFKIDTPTNTNTTKVNDLEYNFQNDVLNGMKIIKSFDLREGTPIGDYIKRYISQREFKYDRSMYVNFSSNEVYYYGIDKSSGVLTEKVENFEEQLLKNDNTIMKIDDWLTSGFERNNLIFPYIINFEFLFDDKDIEEYKFARYFGVYCNDIDMFDLEITGNDGKILKCDDTTEIELPENSISYIKDKRNNLHSYSLKSPKEIKVNGSIDIDDLKGFELDSVSEYAEKIDDFGKAMMVLEINSISDNTEIKVFDTSTELELSTFKPNGGYDAGEYEDNMFSSKGTMSDVAKAIAGAIATNTRDRLKFVDAYSIGNKVIIKSLYPGSIFNNFFDIRESSGITKLTPKFDGGTDVKGCIFKIYSSEGYVFFDKEDEETGTRNDRDEYRYLRSSFGFDNAKILNIIPYVSDGEMDDTYSILITDKNGEHVKISELNQVEILDVFYPKIGILSFFPVRDFDFDTFSSAYGDYSKIDNEFKNLKELPVDPKDISYRRFYDNNGNNIETEYDYYCENILPELAVVNKTTPYIAKWGYADEAKDSCENPYRLNTSKIFDACNFSANTFMQRGDITEFTHSMPYYIVKTKGEEDYNEYQYIPFDSNLETLIDLLSQKKSDGSGDPFDKIFGDLSTTEYKNKRYNKKYSRFLFGNDTVKSSTLFRGVKFEITELNNGKEVKTGKYNGYRFSFIYVPVSRYDTGGSENEKEQTKIYFIKNDDYKFIVGIVLFDILNIDTFDKAHIYAGCMGLLDVGDSDYNNE